MTTVAEVKIGGMAKDQSPSAGYYKDKIDYWKNQGKTVVPLNIIFKDKEVIGIVLQTQSDAILPKDSIELPCPPFCPENQGFYPLDETI
jgi:hypothetical protein